MCKEGGWTLISVDKSMLKDSITKIALEDERITAIYLHGRYGRMNLKERAIKFVNAFDKIISFSRQYRTHKIVLEINFLVKKRFHHLKFSN